MTKREKYSEWVFEALKNLGGKATLIDTGKEIWKLHENDIKRSGDETFTWQYDYRWELQNLEKKEE